MVESEEQAVTPLHHVGRLAHAATLAALGQTPDPPTMGIDDIQEAVTVLTVALGAPTLTDLLTVEEAASIIGIDPSSVRRTVAEGRLTYAHVSSPRRKYLDRSAVIAYRDAPKPRGGRPRGGTEAGH